MTAGWVYPKRTDGVFAIHFDGTQRAAQQVANALKTPVKHSMSETMRVGDRGGELLISGMTPIQTGQYIIVSQASDLIEVIDSWTFSEKYTKSEEMK